MSERGTTFITGASGFVGGRVAQAFKSASRNILVSANRKGWPEPKSEFESITVSAQSVAGLARIFETAQCSSVLHFATHFSSSLDAQSTNQIVESNLKFGILVAEAAYLAGVQTFLNVATSWEFFRTSNPDHVAVFSQYASTKRAFRAYLDERFGDTGFIKHLVLEETIGDTDTRQKLVPMLIRSSWSGELVHLREPHAKLNLAAVDGLAHYLLQASPDFLELKRIQGASSFFKVSPMNIIETLEGLGVRPNFELTSPSDVYAATPRLHSIQIPSLALPVISSLPETLRSLAAYLSSEQHHK